MQQERKQTPISIVVPVLLEDNYEFYVCLIKLGGIDRMTDLNRGMR
jgi:hypothetical protein